MSCIEDGSLFYYQGACALKNVLLTFFNDIIVRLFLFSNIQLEWRSRQRVIVDPNQGDNEHLICLVEALGAQCLRERPKSPSCRSSITSCWERWPRKSRFRRCLSVRRCTGCWKRIWTNWEMRRGWCVLLSSELVLMSLYCVLDFKRQTVLQLFYDFTKSDCKHIQITLLHGSNWPRSRRC